MPVASHIVAALDLTAVAGPAMIADAAGAILGCRAVAAAV